MSKLGRGCRTRSQRVHRRHEREQRAIVEREEWERARLRFWGRLAAEPPAVTS